MREKGLNWSAYSPPKPRTRLSCPRLRAFRCPGRPELAAMRKSKRWPFTGRLNLSLSHPDQSSLCPDKDPRRLIISPLHLVKVCNFSYQIALRRLKREDESHGLIDLFQTIPFSPRSVLFNPTCGLDSFYRDSKILGNSSTQQIPPRWKSSMNLL
jgi:hypothetical protein